MKKKGKKYILKESEINEIANDILLTEIYRSVVKNNKSLVNEETYDINKGIYELLNILKNSPYLFFPNAWRRAIENGDGNILNLLLRTLGIKQDINNTGNSSYALPDFAPKYNQYDGNTQNENHGEEVLSVSKACNFILRNASSRPTNWCARHVRMALNYGGLNAPWGMYAPSAKYYVNILPKNGWYEISPDKAGEPCDIVVIDPCVDSAGGKHENGHIAMCAGDGKWVSDFVQNTVYGLKGTPPVSCVHFYRYRNRVQ